MSQEWVVKILDSSLYYSESGWQSDITHATVYHSREEADKIAFSIVTADPSKVGCVSVEEVPT